MDTRKFFFQFLHVSHTHNSLCPLREVWFDHSRKTYIFSNFLQLAIFQLTSLRMTNSILFTKFHQQLLIVCHIEDVERRNSTPQIKSTLYLLLVSTQKFCTVISQRNDEINLVLLQVSKQERLGFFLMKRNVWWQMFLCQPTRCITTGHFVIAKPHHTMPLLSKRTCQTSCLHSFCIYQ